VEVIIQPRGRGVLFVVRVIGWSWQQALLFLLLALLELFALLFYTGQKPLNFLIGGTEFHSLLQVSQSCHKLPAYENIRCNYNQ
jgi:hypothetical protein